MAVCVTVATYWLLTLNDRLKIDVTRYQFNCNNLPWPIRYATENVAQNLNNETQLRAN